MAFDYTTTFDRIRRILNLTEKMETYQGTTLAADANAVLEGWSAVLQDTSTYRDLSTFQGAVNGFINSNGVYAACKSLASSEIVRQVKANDSNFTGSITSALTELYDLMIADGETVDGNTCSLIAHNPNTTVHQIVCSSTNEKGIASELIYNETLTATWNGTNFRIAGERSVSPLSATWPSGSGVSATLSFGTSLISNGDFATKNTVSSGPDDWEIVTGEDSQIVITALNTQTVIMSSTPTSGFYTLIVTDPDGNVQVTEPLAYNASGSSVQSALRALTGFEDVEVTTTGTSPNYTHTVTFYGIAGTIPVMSSNNETDVGSIAHAVTTSGNIGGYSGYSMYWEGDGSTQYQLKQKLSLSADTVYAGAIWLKKGGSSTGELTIALRDGAGTVINDNAGTSNSTTQDVSTLSSSIYTLKTFFFRTPTDLPDFVYFDLQASTALGNGHNLYFDNVRLVPATKIAGGYYAAHQGDAPTSTQEYTITASNDYVGRIQTAFMRWFGVQLPSDKGGSETVVDGSPSSSPSSSVSSSPSASVSASPSASTSGSPSSSPSSSPSPSSSTSSSPSSSASSSPSSSASSSPSSSASSSPSSSASSSPSSSASSSPSSSPSAT